MRYSYDYGNRLPVNTVGAYSAIPISGTASEVEGIFSATRFRNTVNDSNIVTPVGICQINVSIIMAVLLVLFGHVTRVETFLFLVF